MRKASFQIAACSLSIAVSAFGVDWQYEATSGWIMPGPPSGSGWLDELQNWNHVKRFDMVIDAAGNIFVNAGDGRNFDTINTAAYAAGPGGATIFKPDGQGGWTKTDIDLTHTGLNVPGGITKMVVAGDGKVYALQNWHPPGNNWTWFPWYMLTDGNANTGCTTCKIRSRILRINLDGSVNVIDEQTPPLLNGENWVNKHGGIAVGEDGNVYWWLGGPTYSSGSYWKTHVLWRYNITSGTVEESPTAGVNNGQEWASHFNNLVFVGTSPNGTNWLCPMLGIYTYAHNWAPTAMAWDINRLAGENIGPGGEGRNDCLMEIAYDQTFNKLWTAPRGKGGSCIMRRYNGDPDKPALYDNPVSTAPQTGIVDTTLWHANDNASDVTQISNGGQYWVTDLAVNPGDGSAWMSFGAEAGYNFAGTYGALGPVYTVGPNDTAPTGNEGTPQAFHPNQDKAVHPSQTVAVAFAGTKVYALVVDLVDRDFNLFSADNPMAVLGACCQPAQICSETTKGDCSLLKGVWQGPETTCEGSDCAFQPCEDPFADADGDGDVDSLDFGVFQACMTLTPGSAIREYPPYNCACYDISGNGIVDLEDLAAFTACASGPDMPAAPACDD